MNEAGEGAAAAAALMATSDFLAEQACDAEANCKPLLPVSSLDPDEGPDPDAGSSAAAAGINQAGVTKAGTITPAQADRMNAASIDTPFGCRGITDRPHRSTLEASWGGERSRADQVQPVPWSPICAHGVYRKRWYGQHQPPRTP